MSDLRQFRGTVRHAQVLPEKHRPSQILIGYGNIPIDNRNVVVIAHPSGRVEIHPNTGQDVHISFMTT